MNVKKIGYIIAGFLVLTQIFGVVRGLSRDLSIPSDDDGDNDIQILSEKEVQKEGVPCSSNGHYSISGSAMAGKIEGFILEAEYNIDYMESFSSNYAGTIGEDPWTSYETTAAYYIYLAGSGEEDMGVDSVTVNYDTATGRLHGVDFHMAEAGYGAFMAGKILDFLQENGEIPADMDYGALVEGEILEYSDRGEDETESGIWMEIPGQTEVYFNETDGGIFVRIWRERD